MNDGAARLLPRQLEGGQDSNFPRMSEVGRRPAQCPSQAAPQVSL